MEFVLVGFQIAQLGEFLAAFVQETFKWFGVFMGDFVSADVSSLGEAFLTDIAGEGFLACVTALMGL